MFLYLQTNNVDDDDVDDDTTEPVYTLLMMITTMMMCKFFSPDTLFASCILPRQRFNGKLCALCRLMLLLLLPFREPFPLPYPDRPISPPESVQGSVTEPLFWQRINTFEIEFYGINGEHL